VVPEPIVASKTLNQWKWEGEYGEGNGRDKGDEMQEKDGMAGLKKYQQWNHIG
jgi:hypothetical protein